MEEASRINWPSARNGEQTKLYLPHHWPGGDQDGDDAMCVIKYDYERKILKIVDAENSILDIIHPTDIIGCQVRIEMTGTSAAATNDVGNNSVNSDEGDAAATTEKDDNQCEMLDTLCPNKEGIFQYDNAPTSEIPLDTQAAAFLTIYAYARRDTAQETWTTKCDLHRGDATNDAPNPIICTTPIEQLGHRYPRHRQFQVAAAEDLTNVSMLVRAIRQVAGLPAGRRKFLVVVNPSSGHAKGRQVYESTVKPLLEQAGVDIELLITSHPKHAQERMKESDIADFDGFVAVGGDGILHEIFQGVHDRADKNEVFKGLKIGVVGTGTANGCAKTITHESGELHSHLESTFLIARGQTCPMDLSHYTTTSRSYTSFLTFSWAMIADIDLESEIVRFLGFLRMDLWAALRVLFLRSYRARLSFLPASKADLSKELPDMPNLSDPLPSDWAVVEDDFILFWAAQCSHAAVDTFNSPMSKVNDGVFQIMVIRAPCSRYKVAKALLSLASGTHTSMDAVEFIECVAYRLEPLSSGSYNDLDGERIEDGPVQANVLPSVVQVFCNHQSTN
jgi:sphingosine kinase